MTPKESVMFVLVLTALAAEPAPELHRFGPNDRRLDLEVESGSLTVRTDGTLAAIEVRVSPRTSCVITRGTDATLDVEGCAADVEVAAPFGTIFRLAMGQGDVMLDTTGTLRLAVKVGDVSGSARGPVKLNVGTGDVRLEGLTETPQIAVAAGKTELTYAKGG
jgi:hypothetical protein